MFGLYLDENFQDRVFVGLLRKNGIDCLTSNEAANGGLSDEQQLAFATASTRAILTYDKADFQRLHRDWMRAGREHCGVIIVSDIHIPAPALATRIDRLQRDRDATQMLNAILFIAPSRAEDVQ